MSLAVQLFSLAVKQLFENTPFCFVLLVTVRNAGYVR